MTQLANLINNLGAIANMNPVGGSVTLSNIGPGAIIPIYTVPTNMVTAIDWAMIVWFSGTSPLTLNMTTATPLSRIIRTGPPVINEAVYITNTIWLAPGTVLEVATNGGDATTDLLAGFNGREFQYANLPV